jgi:phosphoribosylglycinamide formyltransferase 1
MLSVVVLISGSGSNLRAILEAAKNPLFPVKVLAVGSDKVATGLEHAEFFGIPTFVVQPDRFTSRENWAEKLAENIEHFSPDLVVLAGFMKILPENFVSKFTPKLINTHPSKLPLFPGAHAVRDALEAKATETGVTVHIVDEGVDTGPVLVQKSVPIYASDTEEILHERIKQVERVLLVETIEKIAEGSLDISNVTRG